MRRHYLRRQRTAEPGALACLSFDADRQPEPVRLPTSKSIAARALILAYVNGNATELRGLPDCDDTRELAEAMHMLREDMAGCRSYDLGTGGTSLRFFLALAASLPGFDARIDCSDALRSRPLKPLIDSLRQAGADIECLRQEGYAPLHVKGRVLDGSGVAVSGAASSQFRSALMMVSQLWTVPFTDAEDAHGVSLPYVSMTRRMVEIFRERPSKFVIEPDWSALSYFYEYALLRPDMDVEVENMPPVEGSLQGDSACAAIFGGLGVETRINPDGSGVLRGNKEMIERLRDAKETVSIDMKDVPDLVPALAVGLCCAGIRFRMTGIGHLRHKESNRLSALSEEMSKAGYRLEAGEDSLSWEGARLPSGEDETHFAHRDHRIAMALAVTAVTRRHVSIRGAEAVTKSFPTFFAQLAQLGIYRRK